MPAATPTGLTLRGGLGRREELDGWLGPFLAALGHAERRRRAPVYLQGLLGPGDRKSLQPISLRA